MLEGAHVLRAGHDPQLQVGVVGAGLLQHVGVAKGHVFVRRAMYQKHWPLAQPRDRVRRLVVRQVAAQPQPAHQLHARQQEGRQAAGSGYLRIEQQLQVGERRIRDHGAHGRVFRGAVQGRRGAHRKADRADLCDAARAQVRERAGDVAHFQRAEPQMAAA